MKKIPLRRCIATDEQLPKKQLLRIVHTPTGEFAVDPSGKMNGRGAYIKKTVEAVDIAHKRHVFDKAFATKVPEELYDEISAYIRAER